MHRYRCLALVLLTAVRGVACLRKGPGRKDKVPARGRVAVLTAGVLLRVFPEETAKNFVAPMVKERFEVDLFLSLNAEPFKAWKGHARVFRPDPAIAGHESNTTFVADVLNRTLSEAGATVRVLALHDRVVLDGEAVEPFLHNTPKSNNSWWQDCPRSRTIPARSNVLKLLYQFEFLWKSVLAAEETHGRYDFVISARDDVMWIRPFSLQAVLHAPDHMVFRDDRFGPLPSHQLSGPPQGYHVRCTERLAGSSHDAIREHGLTEYVMIYKRDVAATFLSLYTRIMGNRTYWNTKNLENFMEQVAEEEHVHFAALPARLIPMSRAGRVDVNGMLTTCFHKACDSGTLRVPFLRPMDDFPPCIQPPFSTLKVYRHAMPPRSLFPRDGA